MRSAVLILESEHGAITEASLETITAAQQAQLQVGLTLVLSEDPVEITSLESALSGLGLSQVIAIAPSSPQSDGVGIQAFEQAVLPHLSQNTTIILSGRSLGRHLASRLAAKLDIPVVSNVVNLSGQGFEQPVYGGLLTQTYAWPVEGLVISLRAKAFGLPAKAEPASPIAVTLHPLSQPLGTRQTHISSQEAATQGPTLEEASIIVSGGRGLQAPEKFELVERLATSLGAAVGASRAVVDAGWRPHAEQVGQTGKSVRPELYVALGISGAIQHLVGMRDARHIVAINRDPDAPIFKLADLGIVGDVFDIVPALIEKISEKNNGRQG